MPGGPSYQSLQVEEIGGKGDGLRDYPVDAGSLGVRCSRPRVGSINSPDGWERQHRQKLTIVPSLWLKARAHNSYTSM
jgi:hypothetical protein